MLCNSKFILPVVTGSINFLIMSKKLNFIETWICIEMKSYRGISHTLPCNFLDCSLESCSVLECSSVPVAVPYRNSVSWVSGAVISGSQNVWTF